MQAFRHLWSALILIATLLIQGPEPPESEVVHVVMRHHSDPLVIFIGTFVRQMSRDLLIWRKF